MAAGLSAPCIWDLPEETGGFAVAFGAEGVDMPLAVTGFGEAALSVVTGAAVFAGVFCAGDVRAPCPFAGDIVVFGPVALVAGVDVSFWLPRVNGVVVGTDGVLPFVVEGTVDVTVLPSGLVPCFFAAGERSEAPPCVSAGDAPPFTVEGEVTPLPAGFLAGVPVSARSLPA